MSTNSTIIGDSANPQLLSQLGLMKLADNWSIVRCGTLLSPDRGISVGVMYPGDHDPLGIPLIRAGDINGNHINPRPSMSISPQKNVEYSRTILQGGELLISLVGNLGQCAVVPNEMAGWNAARAIAVIRLNEPQDAQWLKYCLMSPPLQHLMKVWATTTVQATLNLKEIKQLPLPYPPQKERQAIAHILGALDDKIELNRRMNATLEATARALFKSWFVDFDPVKYKARGEQPPGMDAETAALFPDSFEDSELGPIPAGWRVGTVGNVFNITMGQSPPGETYNEVGEGLPFYQGRRDFGFRYPALRVYCTQPSRIAQVGDTLVSVRAPVGDVNMAHEECCIGRGVAAVRHRSSSRSYTFYSMLYLREQFQNYDGEGTVFGSISGKDFQGLEVVLPPIEAVNCFEKLAYALDEQIEVNERENRTLTETRDALLPKLVSGEVRVGVVNEELQS